MIWPRLSDCNRSRDLIAGIRSCQSISKYDYLQFWLLLKPLLGNSDHVSHRKCQTNIDHRGSQRSGLQVQDMERHSTASTFMSVSQRVPPIHREQLAGGQAHLVFWVFSLGFVVLLSGGKRNRSNNTVTTTTTTWPRKTTETTKSRII